MPAGGEGVGEEKMRADVRIRDGFVIGGGGVGAKRRQGSRSPVGGKVAGLRRTAQAIHVPLVGLSNRSALAQGPGRCYVRQGARHEAGALDTPVGGCVRRLETTGREEAGGGHPEGGRAHL